MERIIAAAVKLNVKGEEKIIPCHRHSDAYFICKELGVKYDAGSTIEGFIAYDEEFDKPTRFVNRVEALLIAEKANQLRKDDLDYFGYKRTGNALFSEDLW